MAEGAAIRAALSRVLERPRLVATAALANLAATELALLLVSPQLGSLLDRAPAAARLQSGDDAPLFQLLAEHPELIALGATGLLLALVLYGLWSWLFAGGLLAALLPEEERVSGASDVALAAVRLGPAMMRLGLLGLLLRLVPLALVALGLFLVRRLLPESGFHSLSLALFVIAAAAALAWSAGSRILDCARGLLVQAPATGVAGALVAGLRTARRRPSATLQLIAASLLAWLVVGAIEHLLGGLLTPWPLALALHLVGTVARATISVTLLLAAARLGERASATAPAPRGG